MTSRRFRTLLCLLTIVALAAGSCGDDGGSSTEADDGTTSSSSSTTTTTVADDDPEPDGATTTTTMPTLTASYRGVSETSIKVGVLLFDLDAILALGVDVGFGDQTEHYQVIFDEINEAGGILGRQIEPVYKFVSPVDAAQADEICLAFLEDEEVFVILGTSRPPDNVLCYTETGDTPFIGAPNGDLTDEVFERSAVPFVFLGRLPSRTDNAILAALELDDAIEGGTVAVHGADADRVESLATAIEARGAAQVVQTVEVADEADQTELATELDRFVERYKTEGVTAVVNLGDNVALLAAWNRAGFGVPLFTSSVDVLTEFIYDQGATDTERQLVRLVSGEGASSLYESGHEPTVECVDRWNTLRPDEPAVPNPGEDDLQNIGVVIQACASIDVLVRAATAAGADLTVASFTSALDTIGAYEPPGQRFASLSSTKWDISDAAKLYRWSDEEGDLVAADDLQVG